MRKIIPAIISFAILPFSALCQTAFSSLDDVWQYAVAHNTSIKNAGYEVEKAQYGKRQAYYDFLPDINASGTFTNKTSIQTTLIPAVIFGGPEGTYRPVQFGQKYIYNAGITAQLEVVNVQSWYNAKLAKETAEFSKMQSGSTKKNVFLQVSVQYYSYLLNKEALKLAAKSVEIADSIFASVNNKFTEGAASLASLDIAKINSEKAQQTYLTAFYQLQSLENSLKAILGMSIKDSLVITQSLKVETIVSQNSMFQDDPTVLLARQQVRLNYSKYKMANAGAYPTLSLSYSSNSQQFDNTFRPFDSNGPQWYPASFWSVRASWNIFNGGSRWLQSNKNKLSYLQSKAEAEQAERQQALNDENLRIAYNKSIVLLLKAESIMNLSFDNYKHTVLRHEEGLAPLDEKLKAFSDYIGYQNQYLNSLSDMLVVLYQIKLRQQTF